MTEEAEERSCASYQTHFKKLPSNHGHIQPSTCQTERTFSCGLQTSYMKLYDNYSNLYYNNLLVRMNYYNITIIYMK